MKNWTRSVEFVFHQLRPQSKSMTRALHDRAARRGSAAHKERDSQNAFMAYNGNLRRSGILQLVEKGDDCSGGEIGVRKRIPRFVQHVAQTHFDVFQVWLPALEILLRQRCKQLIFSWIRENRH